MRKSFIIVMIIICVLTASIFIFSQTTFIKQTDFYVGGHGEEQIENVINALNDGHRLIFLSRNETDDFNYLIDRIYDDETLFWLNMKYNALSIGNLNVLYVREKYDDATSKMAQIDAEANNVIREIISDDMKEYDKVLSIHDWICENITYKEAKDTSDQDIYGALINKQARCAGYAKVFTYLLDKVGIESYVISGDALDENAQSVAHAWNLVYIDHKPYYFDITWNDHDLNGHTYDYFAMTTQEFKLSHFPTKGYDWVDAKSTDASYYVKNGMYMDKYEPMALASQIIRQGKTFSIKCKNRETMSAILDAFNNNTDLLQIMKWTGLKTINKITYKVNENAFCLHVTIKESETVNNWS